MRRLQVFCVAACRCASAACLEVERLIPQQAERIVERESCHHCTVEQTDDGFVPQFSMRTMEVEEEDWPVAANTASSARGPGRVTNTAHNPGGSGGLSIQAAVAPERLRARDDRSGFFQGVRDIGLGEWKDWHPWSPPCAWCHAVATRSRTAWSKSS